MLNRDNAFEVPMNFLAQADLLCSSLWENRKFYTFGFCCDRKWAIFLYTVPSQPPRCVKTGLSLKQVVSYLKGVQNEKA